MRKKLLSGFIVGALALTLFVSGNAFGAALTTIHLQSPTDDQSVSVAPTFAWTTDGGADNNFVIDLAIPGVIASWTSPVLSEPSWTPSTTIWNLIPAGSQITWSVRGADLDVSPLAIITSTESWVASKSASSTVNTSGGDGGPDGGSGGAADYIDIEFYYGSETGPLEVLTAGQADASFTTTPVTANLGDNPYIMGLSGTIWVMATEPAAGVPYLLANNYNLYISDGDAATGDETPVTGIQVNEGVTLTLGLNSNTATEARLDLDNDIDNRGTITTQDADAANRGDLELNIASYIAASKIYTAGVTPGQNGGHVNLYCDYSVSNGGTINTSGAPNQDGNGGTGGYINLDANYWNENTGTLISDGGTAVGASDIGGSAGWIDVEADYGHLWNSGALLARGGDGIDGGGGGNSIYIGADYIGGLLNSGTLDASGGNATAGNGGNGDYVDFYSYGGDLINNANVTTRGGSTTDAASNGGSGGDIYWWDEYGYIYEYTPAGDILISGNMDTRGGNAVTSASGTGNGGGGGYFDVELDADYYPTGQRLALLGYSNLTARGGVANYPGNGDSVNLYNEYSYRDTGEYGPSGNVTNQAAIDTQGGSVAAGATTTPANGGRGGYVGLETDYYYGMWYPDFEHVVNTGNITTRGGNSLESTTVSSGYGNGVWIWGYNSVTNTGNINADGGNDHGTNYSTSGYGNRSGYIDMYTELGAIANSGNLTNNGGVGTIQGGYAQSVELFGVTVLNGGNIASNGGSASVVPAGTGGDGGYVELFSPAGPNGITQLGTVSNSGGTGDTAGDDGDYILGGLLK